MTIGGQQPITVAIAQFEDIVNLGLRSLIQDDSRLRLVAADVAPGELPDTLARLTPDVALLNLAALARPADLRDLHAAAPGVRLVVLADNPTAAQCRQLLGFGATACLAKTTAAGDLLDALHLASQGLQVLPGATSQVRRPAGATPLTSREADVLGLLQDGRSNAEIAAALHLGVETVRTHARSIYRKLGVSTRRELRVIG